MRQVRCDAWRCDGLTHLSNVGFSGDLDVVADHLTPSADPVHLQRQTNMTINKHVKKTNTQAGSIKTHRSVSIRELYQVLIVI